MYVVAGVLAVGCHSLFQLGDSAERVICVLGLHRTAGICAFPSAAKFISNPIIRYTSENFALTKELSGYGAAGVALFAPVVFTPNKLLLVLVTEPLVVSAMSTFLPAPSYVNVL